MEQTTIDVSTSISGSPLWRDSRGSEDQRETPVTPAGAIEPDDGFLRHSAADSNRATVYLTMLARMVTLTNQPFVN